eukprot:gene9856-biopygen11780
MSSLWDSDPFVSEDSSVQDADDLSRSEPDCVIARPLYQLTKQGTAFVWGPEQQQAYDQLKAALMQPGVALRQPATDRPFTLYTDWSTRGIAAVLNQQDEQGREYMVACTSRSLNQAEQNYAAWKGEMLAVIHGLKAFRPYLLSRDFKLITDHRALLWLLTHKQPVGQQARWLLCISEFRFDLQHRPGTDNPADVPSREPVACAADWTGSRLDSAAEGGWLPQVFNADGSKDTTVYSHDQLAAQLCIQPVVKSSSSKAARQPAADTTALAGNMQQLSLAAESSAAAQRRMQQAAYFVAGVDPCTSAYNNVSSEHERGTDQQSAISNQQLASADSLRPSAILASAATAVAPCDSSAYNMLAMLTTISDSSSSKSAYEHHPSSLMGGGDTFIFSQALYSQEPKQEQSAAVAWEQQQLSKSATAWVRQACEAPAPQSAPASSVLSAVYGQPDSSGIRITQRLNTSPVHASFFPAAFSQGIVLYEPCGGLCAGLEMCLRNGISVRRYLYSDIDAVAQRVALHRVRELQTRYPHLLQPEALASSFSALPADIRQVTTAHLQQQLQQSPQQQWLVVAGWPCQDFSSAGRGKGMAGSRAQLLFDMVRIIGALQQLCPAAPPAYLLENVAFQHNRSSSIQQDYQHVCSIIGTPVLIDAAQFGSLAHCLRNFWTNLCSPARLSAALQHVQRPAGRDLSLVLHSQRLAFPVLRQDRPPQFPCNEPGQQRAAWPTLMSRQQSYAFRPGQPGSIIDCSDPAALRWDEPTASEREVALGYLPGSTAAEGVTEQQRCAVLGQCIDANTLQCIMAISAAWWFSFSSHQAASTAAAATIVAAATQLPDSSSINIPSYSDLCDMFVAAAAQETILAGEAGSKEIWTDHPALSALQQQQIPSDLSHAQRTRVQKRLKLYHWDEQQGQLLRRLPDGAFRVVPRPEQRQQLIQQQHQMGGHFGTRRTATLVASKYWWHGLLSDVAAVVRQCEHCGRVRASFAATQPELQSLPISSMGFRWHADLCGPFPVSSRGNTYVLLAVEAFSKHLEAVPIPDKEPATVAYAFLHHVLAKFAAPGMVVTDNGSEFQGAFSKLLEDCLIDHGHTSVAHPRANGQVERAVQTSKTALRALCLDKEDVTDWDSGVAWLALTYRCTKHSSTGRSPYELMFARQPVVPPAISNSMQPAVDYSNPAAAAADLAQRQQLLRRLMPEALQNLAIAQHRDQQRYAVVRSGTYQPRLYRFQQGDFVYLKQQQQHGTLQPGARANILRIAQVKPSGVLLLQGKCGRFTEARQEHCAPCHLPNLDPTIDPVLAFDNSTVCEVCSKERPVSQLLICELCAKGYHMKCLQPQLTTLPEGLWICQPCADAGGTLAEAQRKQAQRQEALDRATLPNLYPDAAMKRRDQQAQQLHGRLIHKSWAEPGKSSRRWFWGRLHYRGPLSWPNYFVAVYEDSDYEIMSAATAKRFLKPAGSQLPAGISIPEVSQQLLQQLASTDLQEREAAAQNLQQQLTAAAAVMPLSVAVPSSADTKLLLSSLDLSRVAFTADPISSNHQLQAQLQQHGVQHMLRQPPFPAAIIIMAVMNFQQQYNSYCSNGNCSMQSSGLGGGCGCVFQQSLSIMAGFLIFHCVGRWQELLRAVGIMCQNAFNAAAQDDAVPRVPLAVYDTFTVDSHAAVLMRTIIPDLEQSWAELDADSVRLARIVLLNEVYEWLQYASRGLRVSLSELISMAQNELRDYHFLHSLPAVHAFNPEPDVTVEDLPLTVAVPVALASTMIMARDGIYADSDDDDDDTDDFCPSMGEAQAIFDNLRTCLLFDGMLRGRARVWGTQHDLQLDQQRRELADAVLSLQLAGLRQVD